MSQKAVVVSIVAITIVAASAAIAGPAIRPVGGSRRDVSLTATTKSRETYLAARDMLVDVEMADGRSRKGQLTLLFEPSSGLYYQLLVLAKKWEGAGYGTYRFLDKLGNSRIGVTSDKLTIVSFAGGGMVRVDESAERAVSMDDAEAKCLKWDLDHIADIDKNSTSYRLFGQATHLPFSVTLFPGFYHEHDARHFLPLRLIDIKWHETPSERRVGWELTLEETDGRHRKVKMWVWQAGDTWVLGAPSSAYN